jgi:hypothetical protein
MTKGSSTMTGCWDRRPGVGSPPTLHSMVTLAAVVMCLLLAAVAAFQVLLLFGVPLGRFAWGAQHRVLPMTLRVGSVMSVVIYELVSAIVAARADLMIARCFQHRC